MTFTVLKVLPRCFNVLVSLRVQLFCTFFSAVELTDAMPKAFSAVNKTTFFCIGLHKALHASVMWWLNRCQSEGERGSQGEEIWCSDVRQMKKTTAWLLKLEHPFKQMTVQLWSSKDPLIFQIPAMQNVFFVVVCIQTTSKHHVFRAASVIPVFFFFFPPTRANQVSHRPVIIALPLVLRDCSFIIHRDSSV